MRGPVLQRARAFSLCVLPALLLMTGCNPPKDRLATFNRYLEAGDYGGSLTFAQKQLKPHKQPKGEDLLWSLQAGSVARLLGRHQDSTVCFDRSEEMLGFYDQQPTIADGLATTTVNENALPYRGQEYDGVMVNTYKALNFMAQGKMDLARVELNRALDRQRRAKEKFSKEIQRLGEEIDKKSQGKSLYRSNVDNPKVAELLAEKYPNLYAFEAYPDFVNPFATYLAGVFFASQHDYSKAVDLLKESYGMVPDNQYIAEDLMAVEKTFEGQGPLGDTVWVIFENGLGPAKEEFRLDIPLFVATEKVLYAGIALPRLRLRDGAYTNLSVQADGNTYETRLVASMERVIQTEFKKDFDVILQRAIVSATAKVLAQYAFQSDDSPAGTCLAVVMAVYSFTTTAADVRIWTTLPKDFQVARFRRPQDGIIEITPAGGQSFEVKVADCSNAIVYVRIATKRCSPVCEVIKF